MNDGHKLLDILQVQQYTLIAKYMVMQYAHTCIYNAHNSVHNSRAQRPESKAQALTG